MRSTIDSEIDKLVKRFISRSKRFQKYFFDSGSRKQYFVLEGNDHSAIRIGQTKQSIKDRVCGQRNGNRRKLRIVSVRLSDKKRDHGELKARFRPFDIGNEWFSVSPEVAVDILRYNDWGTEELARELGNIAKKGLKGLKDLSTLEYGDTMQFEKGYWGGRSYYSHLERE